MYLKQINAYGFKSFADKLDIKLDDEITCIVGPNGSGKSNVVDAVRWVLGEQSIKQLRGDGGMSDVIFSGSKSRKALNVATVELVFDNNDHYLNIPYTEISIKRKAYRSGENEYFLNNERCRLKDVNNLLLDSGIGKESYNIISQGEVDKIISSSSQDRRTIIEDAAGVVKYKKRKEEALKKLDKTNNNLNRVNDIILELEAQVEPLKEQSIKAKEYLENKKNLEELEVALLVYDINNDSEEEKKLKEKLDKTEEKLALENLTNDNNDLKILEWNSLLSIKQEELKEQNKKLLEIVEECEKINSEKLLLQEKVKHINSNDSEVYLRENLEKKGIITAQISVLEEEIDDINRKLNVESGNLIGVNRDLDDLKSKKKLINLDYSKLQQELITATHKIDSLKTDIDNGAGIPLAVKKVLTENSLYGIYNTIGNVIEIDNKYTKALEVAIASSKHFIITENEECSKKAINYLKDEHLGRATFFPLSVIKSRYIDENSLHILKQQQGFIAVLSDLVEYDKKYKNIIENQLGIQLVVEDIDVALEIAKKINHRYKIITLEGDTINVGGSMTGGNLKTNNKSIITLRQELNFIENKNEELQDTKINLEKEIDDINKEIEVKEEEYFKYSKREVSIREELKEKEKNLESKKEEEQRLEKEIESLKNIVNDSVTNKEKELIELYYEKTALKDKTKLKIDTLNQEILDLKRQTDEMNASYKLKNMNIRNLEKDRNEISIRLNRLDVNIDNMLNTLNEEYSLTFEGAKSKYSLSVEPEEARQKVTLYRNNIKKLGMVNLASIDEFERVNTRYQFLCRQKEDLINAQNSLLEIMEEMDQVIEEEFKKTYENVNIEFTKAFKELFSGGNAYLQLTDPENMLTTGVDIVASPPGKKLSSISLLSGGEKTLTAISLLFSILNVREVPFCLFDEVEAALDEANVDQFGKYLENYRNKTQFLIITHKKKTMEYADTLYGITMQESGVSKLVSVKLNEHIDQI